MNSYKQKLTLVLVFFIPILLGAQNIKYSIEYSPHFSNISGGDISEPKFKFNQDFSLRLNYLLSDDLSLQGRIGVTNWGYRLRPNPGGSSSGGINFADVITISNANYFHLNIGNTFKINQFFFSTEVGMAFIMSNSLRSITIDEDGGRSSRRISKNKADFQFTLIPFTLSIGRKVELFNATPIFGLKGYYAFSRSKAITNYAIYGAGLFVGFEFW